MNGDFNGQKSHVGFQFFKNSRQAIELLGVFRTDIGLVARRFHLVQVPDEQIKVLVERGLRLGVERNGGRLGHDQYVSSKSIPG